MKPIVFISFLFLSFTIFSQDEIIDRETMEAAQYELKIIEVKKDTFLIRAFGKIEKWPSSAIIAYRKDYRSGTSYIFPNPSDSIYSIVNQKVVKRKELKYQTIDPALARDKLVEPYLTNLEYKKLKTRAYHYVLVHRITGEKYKIPNKSGIKIELIDDKSKRRVPCRVFSVRKDTSDLLVYTKYKNQKRVFLIKAKDIQSIFIETPLMLAARITTGVLTLPTIAPAPWIFRFKWYKRFDVNKIYEVKVEPD